MVGVLHLWNEWEIQILVLVSFSLQVFLLAFAWMRRRSVSSPALGILLWLMYLLADYTATYTLGHMSMGCKAGEHQQLMAFWAPFLLVHLGGQDTITAYAMEDSQLWLRHLLSFAVQALGAAYVLYKYIGSRGPLVTPAALMFLVGVLKNGERVWALGFSRLEIIRRYLDGVSIEQKNESYSVPHSASSSTRQQQLDDEWILLGAHDLLYICMGQFVDDKIWPSVYQTNAMELFHENNKTFELIEMQLSLMYDIFYTKAAVIHTWYGRCVRAISLLATVMAFFLFQFSAGKDGGGYNGVDAAVTYILVIGAFILEMASVLRAMGSTWTCATLKLMEWDCLHSLHASLRRRVRIAQTRRWSGSIGQLNLPDSYTGTDDTSLGSRWRGLGSKMISFFRNGGNGMISTDAKELVLEEIQRMVEACAGREDVMSSYRGQCSLERLVHDHTSSSLPDGLFLAVSAGMEFNKSILTWHLATHKLLSKSELATTTEAEAQALHHHHRRLVEATEAISNYMMFLLVERPHMLPSPARPTLHLKAKQELLEMPLDDWSFHLSATVAPGARLGDQLLRIKESGMPEPKLLRAVLGVWVEMLCYAAHHCSRESHARQLNNGGEFITIVWLLSTAEFNRNYCDPTKFKERTPGSIWNFMNFVDSQDFKRYILISILVFTCAIFFCIFWPFIVIYAIYFKLREPPKPRPRRNAVRRSVFRVCLPQTIRGFFNLL